MWYTVAKGFDGTYTVEEVLESEQLEALGYTSYSGYVSSHSVKKYVSDSGGTSYGVSEDYDSLVQVAAKKNQVSMTPEQLSQLPYDITGEVKLAKKGLQYDVLSVKDYSWSTPDYYVVDVKSGTIVTKSYYLDSAKSYASSLNLGYNLPESYAGSNVYGYTIELPPSVQKQQQQLLNPKPKKTKPVPKPLGSNATSVVQAVQKNGYTIYQMADGTYGYFVPSTGMSHFGYKYAGFAEKSAKKGIQTASEAAMSAMGMDPANTSVEALLGAYEDRMRDMYAQAAEEMAQKQAKMMERFESGLEDMRGRLASGQISQDEFDAWLKSQNMTQKWYSDMVNSLSQDAVDADKKALDMLNGYVPSAYAEGMNYATYQIEEAASVNTGFALYNKEAVARLVSQPNAPLLPAPKVDVPTDKAWNVRKLNAAISQSILQGEGIPDASKRLMSVLGMSANAAMRTARTALTGAMNSGRLEAGRRAVEMGIELKKQWFATYDERTRDSHRQIDREVADIEQPFSNGCMMPGDPAGEPSEVYNCRCAMRYVLPGHEYDDLPDTPEKYQEWKDEHLTKLEAKKEKYQQQLNDLQQSENDLKNSMPENKTYKGIWKDDVTLEDWEAKKGTIAAKEEYYLQKIMNAPNTPAGDVQVMVAKNNLMKLNEFNTLGEQYAAAKAQIANDLGLIQDKKKSITEKLISLGVQSTYSDERKAAAFRWSDARLADNVLRRYTSDVWQSATQAERRAVWGYTAGSGKYNRPLSGFLDRWGPANYVGIGQVDLDHEGGLSAIRHMTDIVSRSSFDEDVWLRRGCGTNSMDSFFGTDFGAIQQMSTEELQQFVGHSNRIAAFVSCGTAAEGGAGFNDVVDMRIFVPSGTQAIYAEPFSNYGADVNGSGTWHNGAAGLDWDGVSGQSMFSGEDETIIQRGASYTCTKIEKTGYNRLYVEFEVHPEDGYDLFGQTD